MIKDVSEADVVVFLVLFFALVWGLCVLSWIAEELGNIAKAFHEIAKALQEK